MPWWTSASWTLYAASQRGVAIDLLVRGPCVLRPGVTGLSETIRVRSIVGRFLEHSRIYRFGVGESSEVWIGSADMMDRNLDRRFEALVRIDEPALMDRLDGILDLAWADNTHAWNLAGQREMGARRSRSRADQPPGRAHAPDPAGVSRELELKFAVGRAFAMPDLIGAGSVARVLPIPTQELEATYYDTVDRRLARWGITLRHRTANGARPPGRLLPDPGGRRSGDHAGLAGRAGDRGRSGWHSRGPRRPGHAHIRSRPLTPAAVLATKRAGWRLAGDGHDVAELTNDDVSVMEGGDVRSRFSELARGTGRVRG